MASSASTQPDRPHVLVCNTDSLYKSGRHWVAIYVKDGHGKYFDSFGRRPITYFERYLKRHCRLVVIGFLPINSYKVLSVNFVDITVFAIVCIVFVVSILVALL